jgi:hypothetical protein
MGNSLYPNPWHSVSSSTKQKEGSQLRCRAEVLGDGRGMGGGDGYIVGMYKYTTEMYSGQERCQQGQFLVGGLAPSS